MSDRLLLSMDCNESTVSMLWTADTDWYDSVLRVVYSQIPPSSMWCWSCDPTDWQHTRCMFPITTKHLSVTNLHMSTSYRRTNLCLLQWRQCRNDMQQRSSVVQ